MSEGRRLLGDLRSYLDSLLVAIKPFQIHHNFFLVFFKGPPFSRIRTYFDIKLVTPQVQSTYILSIFKEFPALPTLK